MICRIVAVSAILLLLLRTVTALSKETLGYETRYLLYNVEGDCFVGAIPTSDIDHYNYVCDSNSQDPNTLKNTWFITSHNNDKGTISYNGELEVRWDGGSTETRRHLHVHFGDHKMWDYNKYRSSMPTTYNSLLDRKVYNMTVYLNKLSHPVDRWKLLSVESNNAETLTKVRFKQSHTNHYLVVLPETPSSKVSSAYGWLADEDPELFCKYGKHTDFMLILPKFPYARSLNYLLDGSDVKFSWKLNKFGGSSCSSLKLNVGCDTVDIVQTSESHTEIVPYSRIARQNLGNSEWFISCDGENVSINSGQLDLPRITNIRVESATPLFDGDDVKFQWDVLGSNPSRTISAVIKCSETQVMVISNVFESGKIGTAQIIIPHYCSGKTLLFDSDAGVQTFEVTKVQLETLVYHIDYLNSRLHVIWKMNFGKATANRASAFEISVNIFNTTTIAYAADNGIVMDLASISSTGASFVTLTKPSFVFDYNWPTAKLGVVRRVSLESKSSFFIDTEYATLTINSVGPFIVSSAVMCGSSVLKTISETESCIPFCQVEVPVAGCHLKPLKIDVEGIKTELLQDKLIVLPTIWHIENMKGELQGKDLKLTWTKPDFCKDVDVVLVKSNLDDKEWNICSASETIADFTTNFGSEKELILIRPGVTFAVKHVLPTSITFTWKELDDEKGILTWNEQERQSYGVSSSTKILNSGKIVADFSTVQSSFLIRWDKHPVLDRTGNWQIEIFGHVFDVEPPYKYYSRIENIQMEEKSSLYPGDFVSVFWTSAGPVSPKSVSAELRCNDMILNRLANVFNTSRIQVQVYEECKERGLLFQSDAGTEMISVSHMKLYELRALNYKIDYLEGLMNVSWKLNSDEEESNRVTEMNVTLFGVEQQINAKQQTINLDLTEMDLKRSNQLTFSHSQMKFQYSWPNVKLGGVRQVKVDSLPNEIEANDELNIHLIMKSELIAPVICKCGDNVLLTVSEIVLGTSTYSIPIGFCDGKNVALDVEGIETIVLVPLVTLKQKFPWILVIICSVAGGLLLIIVGLISWHCYRVRKRKRQAALLRAFGNGKLHIFHIGEFK